MPTSFGWGETYTRPPDATTSSLSIQPLEENGSAADRAREKAEKMLKWLYIFSVFAAVLAQNSETSGKPGDFRAAAVASRA
jgi:hypothetical protein